MKFMIQITAVAALFLIGSPVFAISCKEMLISGDRVSSWDFNSSSDEDKAYYDAVRTLLLELHKVEVDLSMQAGNAELFTFIASNRMWNFIDTFGNAPEVAWTLYAKIIESADPRISENEARTTSYLQRIQFPIDNGRREPIYFRILNERKR